MVGDFQEKMASPGALIPLLSFRFNAILVRMVTLVLAFSFCVLFLQIIPEKFVENFKGQISEVIKLEAPDGNKYDVQATRDLNKIVLGSGWATFATSYELKEGDVLVFRYSGDSHFRVLIFDYPSFCEKEVFHVVMNCGPNTQEKDTRLDQSPVSETRRQNGGSGDGESHQRCGHCDVHFYWHHLDDRDKHFVRLMIGDFRQEMVRPWTISSLPAIDMKCLLG
jgi:hypothetical protein